MASLGEIHPVASENHGLSQSFESDAVLENASNFVDLTFASRYAITPLEKNKFPASSMPARVAQQLIRDQRHLDANPRLNLASFVTTWMEPEVDELMMESKNINYIDESEYPSTTAIQQNCVSMLADLWHAEEACGTATVGSSEAILLGGMAMKRRWQEKRRAEGKSTTSPNMVCGSEVHVCWEKLFNYFEIESRLVPLTEDTFVASPEAIAAACDENTIGVVGIMGTTYSGDYEDIAAIDKLIGEVNEKNGWDIGIHVDAASGGFVTPFLYPDLPWDFRLKNVVSINGSGHKYGLVYPGVGWVLFKSKKHLPESLVFHDNYLGNDQISFTLNFSKGAAQIIAQYYQFVRLGRPGYTKIIQNCYTVAMHLAKGVDAIGAFKIVSPRAPKPGLPLVTFTLLEKKRTHGYDEFDLVDRLRGFGWVVPAYTMAPNAQKVKVMRVLCREDFSIMTSESFLADLKTSLAWLDAHYIYTPDQLEAVKNARPKFEAHKKKHTAPHKHGVC